MGSFCPDYIEFHRKKVKFGFKYDMKSLVSFDSTTQKSENLFSMGSFCPKYTRFELQ